MDLGLKDKIAIVGGGSKGLGKASAEVLAQEGAKVTICSRTQADLEDTAEQIRQSSDSEILVFAGDLDRLDTIEELIATTVDHFGRIDILVNNSGGPPHANAATASEELWDTALQRSLLLFARMCREAIPHMIKQGGGRIINILSSSVYQPLPHLVLSGATRAGVAAYAKSLADEVGSDNILVNNVIPGAILTERMLSNTTAQARERGISTEERLAERASSAALGRLGEPREFANLVAFLASDKAGYITGSNFRVDGGSIRSNF